MGLKSREGSSPSYNLFPNFFQRLEEVKIKSRVYSDYDNSLMVGLSVTYFHPRVIKELSGGKRFIEIREADAHKRFLNHHLL